MLRPAPPPPPPPAPPWARRRPRECRPSPFPYLQLAVGFLSRRPAPAASAAVVGGPAIIGASGFADGGKGEFDCSDAIGAGVLAFAAARALSASFAERRDSLPVIAGRALGTSKTCACFAAPPRPPGAAVFVAASAPETAAASAVAAA